MNKSGMKIIVSGTNQLLSKGFKGYIAERDEFRNENERESKTKCQRSSPYLSSCFTCAREGSLASPRLELGRFSIKEKR